jgi:cell division protein FtsZ
MAEVLPEPQTFARIRVIGVGGGGNAAVERMIHSGVQGIEFVAVNTDAQALHYSRAPRKVHIGKETTRGLGAGADPEVGRKSAEESEKEIYDMLKGSDMVFVTFGAGGGTGGGAGPLIAAAARETGALVVGICTKPFTFEGERRRKNAEGAIEELKENVDTLITIPNDRLLQMIDRKTSLLDAFSVVDDVLRQGVQGISDLITIHGLINLDFADIKAIMSNAGSALMGIGRASGENRAIEAARQAIDSPLLEVSVDGAKGVLFNITGGRNMSMHEIDEAAKTITAAVDPDANIIFGAVLDESLEDDVKITVVATGFDEVKKSREFVPQRTDEREPEPRPVVVPEPERYIEEEPMMVPGFSRRPFIDESPRTAPAPDPEPIRREEILPAEPPAVSSIEPDPDPQPERRRVDLSGEPMIQRSGSLLDNEPEPAAPVDTPAFMRKESEAEDDDLDIPAFIRRKVE